MFFFGWGVLAGFRAWPVLGGTGPCPCRLVPLQKCDWSLLMPRHMFPIWPPRPTT